MSVPLHVLTTRRLPESFPGAAFEGRCEFEVAETDDELRSAVRRANVLYSWQVPDTVPEETPHLEWIQLPSAGADHLHGSRVWESTIPIASSVGIHAVPMTEHFFAMLLALSRQIPWIVRSQDRQTWSPYSRQDHPIGELRGKTLGIIGWGKIGESVAHLAAAMGMRVIGTRWSLSVPREVSIDAGPYSDPPWLEPDDLPPHIVYPAAQLHDVLAQSDIVLSLLPATPETHHALGADEFASMKRGALFFNLGRGSVVDEEALNAALGTGRLAGAGLDVFQCEPLPRTSPLWRRANVIVSPHVGGVSPRTAERAAELFAVNLSRYLAGQPLLNVVNKSRGY
jgi:phosphoglycerate dehydrogenase-like enzyme